MSGVRWYRSAAFRVAALALIAGLVVAPIVLIVQARVLEHARDRGVAEYLQDLVDPAAPETCEELREATARRRHGVGRRGGPREEFGPPVLVFDSRFAGERRLLPAIPATLRQRLQRGETWASGNIDTPRGDARLIVASVEIGPDCAFLGTLRPIARDDGGRSTVLAALSIGSALAAMLAAFLPSLSLVRRLRKLTRRVEAGGAPETYRIRGNDEIAMISEVFYRRSHDLVQTQEALLRSQRSIEEHVAQTSHDLRTPLTVLQQRLYRAKSSADHESASHIDAAMAEASYISSLLGNLNTVARLEALRPDNVHAGRVDLKGIIERVVQRYHPLANARGVSLAAGLPEEPLTTTGDATLVEQLVSNLVENSVKHVPAGGNVAVVLEEAPAAHPGSEGAHEAGAGSFLLSFRDTGNGPYDDEWRAAEAWQQPSRNEGSAAAQAHTGGGKGLQIAMRVAQLHGWSIRRQALDDGFAIEVSG